MSIVKIKNKKTGITYVYESESYWDKEKKQPRNHRKLIGKLDDDGNIVPTGNRGRKRKESNEPDKSMADTQMDVLEENLRDYRNRTRELETQNTLLREKIVKLEKEKKELLKELAGLCQKFQ